MLQLVFITNAFSLDLCKNSNQYYVECSDQSCFTTKEQHKVPVHILRVPLFVGNFCLVEAGV